MAGRLTGLLTGRLTDICYPSGILPVSFRYPSGVQVKLRVRKLTCPSVAISYIGVYLSQPYGELRRSGQKRKFTYTGARVYADIYVIG